jgi:nuclear pore complex protein Nup155
MTKYISNVSRDKIIRVLNDLTTLNAFFEENKPFIEGLTGSEGLLRGSTGLIQGGGSRAEEVALQAEHRAMLCLLKFLEYAIQGIEFYLILDDDYSTQRQKLHDVVSRLPGDELRQQILKMTFEDLFTVAKGREIVKEMVNVMVGLGVSGKTSVEAVTETLRVRCPAFCSGDDVIVYRVFPPNGCSDRRRLGCSDGPKKLLRAANEWHYSWNVCHYSKEVPEVSASTI